ncbi:acyltransferase [Pseudarthrobacter sp. fls2-241-R2A-168]|uniref:acyltransferase family protein n=1 Tax=Pseudarthrobacter sp. fls2-241-R2A-168 TaxID=3040304 RepID=UPI002552A5CB|nr:acyltransferase [Pseudarthrobacter sp. fls2-241-R2A-168]
MAHRHDVLDPPKVKGPRLLAGRYAHIDAMRAFAVLLVVLQHAGLTFIPGPSGVTVFFVISGFVITSILIKERVHSASFNAGAFYAKRAFKLAPPFMVAILLPTLLLGPILKTFNVDWPAFLSQIFFAYNWVQVGANREPTNLLPGSQVVWSLAVEEQFYIAFALLWLFLVRGRNWLAGLQVVAVVGILGATFWRMWLVYDGASDIRIARATDTRIDAIGWGIAAAVMVHLWQTGRLDELRHLGKDWALLLGGAFFVVGFAPLGSNYEMTFRYTFHALAALFVIVYGMIPGKSAIKACFQLVSAWKPINIIGLASYSIYLLHYVLLDVMKPTLDFLPTMPEVAVTVAVGVGAGIGLYYLVEVPARKLQQRMNF